MTLPRRRMRIQVVVRRVVPTVLLAASSLALVAPQARAAVTTSFTGAVLSVTGDAADDNITLSRTTAGEFRLDGRAIGGGPTVSNTDRVEISTGGGSNIVTVDFRHGAFEPGLTHEASGKSEIEVDLTGGGGDDLFRMFGTPSNDRMNLGVRGLNWNGDGDVDVTQSEFRMFSFLTYDGDDSFDARGDSVVGPGFPRRVFLDGGHGDDTLFAGPAPAIIDARTGRDRLVGGPSADSLGGGVGDDVFTGGGGNDLFAGGSGVDRVVERAAGSLTITDGKIVGATGTDRLSSIHSARLEGGAGPDTFDATHFHHPVTLLGLGGADVMMGGPLADALSGGVGNDRLFGGAGSDHLGGGPGSDHGDGGPGADVCTGVEVTTSYA